MFKQGELVFKKIKEAGLERGIRIRVAQNQPSKSAPDEDTRVLDSLGAAIVRNVDFNRLIGTGILHTKLWVVDGKHFFVGSANMDWRSLTQVLWSFLKKGSNTKLNVTHLYVYRLRNWVPPSTIAHVWQRTCPKFLKFIGRWVRWTQQFLTNGPRKWLRALIIWIPCPFP